MDEVWNGITLPSDLRHPSASAARVFQDFISKDPPPPTTVLKLSSSQHDFRPQLWQPVAPLRDDDDVAAGDKKRLPDSQRCSGDRRHKRMMKNRVAAARSRARKQEIAYTNELELQVAHLREENVNLKKQKMLFARATDGEIYEENKILHRTSSSPF